MKKGRENGDIFKSEIELLCLQNHSHLTGAFPVNSGNENLTITTKDLDERVQLLSLAVPIVRLSPHDPVIVTQPEPNPSLLQWWPS